MDAHNVAGKDCAQSNLAAHLACGHLLGVVKEEKGLIPILNKECYEVCQNCLTTYLLNVRHATQHPISVLHKYYTN